MLALLGFTSITKLTLSLLSNLQQSTAAPLPRLKWPEVESLCGQIALQGYLTVFACDRPFTQFIMAVSGECYRYTTYTFAKCDRSLKAELSTIMPLLVAT